ncbi:hypothetical protein AB5I41_00100 [Sphingomonas sp. MMS24-JH45]
MPPPRPPLARAAWGANNPDHGRRRRCCSRSSRSRRDGRRGATPPSASTGEYYLLVGDRLFHGALPYVDVWDRKPVGLFLVFAAIRWLGGDGVLDLSLSRRWWRGARRSPSIAARAGARGASRGARRICCG